MKKFLVYGEDCDKKIKTIEVVLKDEKLIKALKRNRYISSITLKGS